MARYQLKVNIETSSPEHSLTEQSRLYDLLKSDLSNGDAGVDGDAHVFISSLSRVRRWPPMGSMFLILVIWALTYSFFSDALLASICWLFVLLQVATAAVTYRRRSNWRVE